jgi:hypothetical protein
MRSLLSGAAVAALLFATPAAAQDLEFWLVNLTDTAIVEFYVSPADSDVWEDDLMAGYYLDAQSEVSVIIADGLTTCIYDIATVFDDGFELEDYGLDLCELGEYTFE